MTQIPEIYHKTNTGLEEFREYSVAVSALTDSGPGPFSSLQSVTTLEDGNRLYRSMNPKPIYVTVAIVRRTVHTPSIGIEFVS